VTPYASPGLSSAYQAPVWFRDTYTAARLKTLDRGGPVSVYRVAKELGHGSVVVVERVCSHVGAVRHRADAVEFRVERHAVKLGDRLVRLGVFAVLNGKQIAESEVVSR
jgi:hypothetical protein